MIIRHSECLLANIKAVLIVINFIKGLYKPKIATLTIHHKILFCIGQNDTLWVMIIVLLVSLINHLNTGCIFRLNVIEYVSRRKQDYTVYHKSMLSYEIQWIKTMCATYCVHRAENTRKVTLWAIFALLSSLIILVLMKVIIILRLTYSWDCLVVAIIADVLCQISLQHWEATLDIIEVFHLKANHYSIQAL